MPFRFATARWCATLLSIALLAAAGPEPAVADASGAHWTRLGAPAGDDRAEALALDDALQRLAVGGERGVAWGPVSGPLERVLSRGPVRALAFMPDGTLLAGTDAGLYRIEGPGRVIAERIGTGEASRDVNDLDVAAGRAAAATAAGVFVRDTGRAGVWRRVTELPNGEARGVALLADADGGLSIWAIVDGALWTTSPGRAGERVPLASAALGEEGVLSLTRGGDGTLYAVLPRSLAVRDADARWRVERLVLPPGATPLRLRAESGRLWLATDAGLLLACGPAGPWRRAGPPAGHVAVSAVAGAGARLVVASAHGLLRHASGASAVADAAPTVPGAPERLAPPQEPALRAAVAASEDPPVAWVQQQALRYLALEPGQMRRLWRAAGRSGLYPELSVRGDFGHDFDRGRDYDEAFLSGGMRRLQDRDRSESDGYGVTVELSWDLGVAAFNPEHVDVSREARLVAQLRDDVLDEINQLYFERQRVLASIEAPPPDTTPALLRLRADELASGLDAWTGGWFSAQLARE
jgi:hypothetical protein